MIPTSVHQKLSLQFDEKYPFPPFPTAWTCHSRINFLSKMNIKHTWSRWPKKSYHQRQIHDNPVVSYARPLCLPSSQAEVRRDWHDAYTNTFCNRYTSCIIVYTYTHIPKSRSNFQLKKWTFSSSGRLDHQAPSRWQVGKTGS